MISLKICGLQVCTYFKDIKYMHSGSKEGKKSRVMPWVGNLSFQCLSRDFPSFVVQFSIASEFSPVFIVVQFSSCVQPSFGAQFSIVSCVQPSFVVQLAQFMEFSPALLCSQHSLWSLAQFWCAVQYSQLSLAQFDVQLSIVSGVQPRSSLCSLALLAELSSVLLCNCWRRFAPFCCAVYHCQRSLAQYCCAVYNCYQSLAQFCCAIYHCECQRTLAQFCCANYHYQRSLADFLCAIYHYQWSLAKLLAKHYSVCRIRVNIIIKLCY